MIEFEWDPRKAATNARKHGIQFADAIPVLEDQSAITLMSLARNDGSRLEWTRVGPAFDCRVYVAFERHPDHLSASGHPE